MKKIEELTAKILAENPSVDRYQIAIAAAKRGDELSNGAVSKLNVDPNKVKTTDIALMEIAEGLVSIKGFENL